MIKASLLLESLSTEIRCPPSSTALSRGRYNPLMTVIGMPSSFSISDILLLHWMDALSWDFDVELVPSLDGWLVANLILVLSLSLWQASYSGTCTISHSKDLMDSHGSTAWNQTLHFSPIYYCCLYRPLGIFWQSHFLYIKLYAWSELSHLQAVQVPQEV